MDQNDAFGVEAGSWKVIAEGRESGNVGVFRPNGTAHTLLINRIISKIAPQDILWRHLKKSTSLVYQAFWCGGKPW